MNDKVRATLTDAVYETLISPNESDSNGEPANVVDGLYSIARAIRLLAVAIERHGQPTLAIERHGQPTLAIERHGQPTLRSAADIKEPK